MSGGPSIHAVDDDPRFLSALVSRLTPLGYRVSSFASADAFLSALPTLEPGCVLMDLGMAPLDGCAALLIMRDYPIGWPVIMLSETAAADIADLCMLAGADLHLAKDCDPALLLSSVEALAGDFAAAPVDVDLAPFPIADGTRPVVDAKRWNRHKDALSRGFLRHLQPAAGEETGGDSDDAPLGTARR